MNNNHIDLDELKSLIKEAVREELADFFFRNPTMISQNQGLPNGNKKLGELELSTRLETVLHRCNIMTLQEIYDLDKTTFLRMRGTSRRLWDEIVEKVAEETSKNT
jgi:DNA-directed RNA polymerase alpha subunit